MSEILSIGVGGFVGSVTRYLMSAGVSAVLGRDFPYGAFAVNALGCLAMGLLFVLFSDRLSESALWRAGVLIGALGGFTTFSSFAVETFNLIDDGEPIKAGFYAVGSVVVCVIGTWVGVLLPRSVHKFPAPYKFPPIRPP